MFQAVQNKIAHINILYIILRDYIFGYIRVILELILTKKSKNKNDFLQSFFCTNVIDWGAETLYLIKNFQHPVDHIWAEESLQKIVLIFRFFGQNEFQNHLI